MKSIQIARFRFRLKRAAQGIFRQRGRKLVPGAALAAGGLVLIGAALWAGVGAVSTWVDAHTELDNLGRLTPAVIAADLKEAQKSGDFFAAFGTDMFSDPNEIRDLKLGEMQKMQDADIRILVCLLVASAGALGAWRGYQLVANR